MTASDTGRRFEIPVPAVNQRVFQLKSLFKNQKLFPLYWSVLALLVVTCDYVMGPYIQFPFLFIIPVVLASWYSGRRWGLMFAIILERYISQHSEAQISHGMCPDCAKEHYGEFFKG